MIAEAPDLSVRANSELEACSHAWKGGYYEGDPLDPMAPSTYGLMGYMSILHVTYLMCMKPYVNSSTRVLEIGPGRGAWTKCLVSLGAREIWCVDALSAENNGFWEYVGHHDQVKYFQVKDFTLSMVPGEHLDFFFSFGCFCHISADLIGEYFKNLFPKLKKGAHGFAMIADYDKRNAAMDSVERFSFMRMINSRAFLGRRYIPIRMIHSVLNWILPPQVGSKLDKNEDNTPKPDRWYHTGTSKACEMLESSGFEVLEKDVGIIHRDPIVHFRKPS